MNNILNSKKSISSESLSVIQQKFEDKSLLKRAMSIGFFSEEINIKANQKKEQFIGVLNRFFENFQKNLLDQSINWLKGKFEKKSLAKLMPLNEKFLKNFNTKFPIKDNGRKRKGSDTQLNSPKSSVLKNKRGRRSIFDEKEKVCLFESFSNNNRPDRKEILRLFELFGSKFSEQQITNWFNNTRKKGASFPNNKRTENFNAIEENLEEEMPSELENQVYQDIQGSETECEIEDQDNESEFENEKIQESESDLEDGEIHESDSELEDGDIHQSDSELEDGEIHESDSELEDGEIHESDSEIEDGEIRRDINGGHAFKNFSLNEKQSGLIGNQSELLKEKEKFFSETTPIQNQSAVEQEESSVLNTEEFEEGEIRDDFPKRVFFIENQTETECDLYSEGCAFEDEMVGIVEENGYPSEFLFSDNYRYDDSILNANLIDVGQSIINDGNILEINLMVDKLKNDHFEEIQNYINIINELELKIQNLQDSNESKQKLIKEISIDFDLVNNECENFEKTSKLKEDKLYDLENAYQDLYTAYDKLSVQNEAFSKEKTDLIDKILKLENYISELENIKKTEIPKLIEKAGCLNQNGLQIKNLEESVNALTNELRLSYEANEKITANYEEKIKILNEEFDKSQIYAKENLKNELERGQKDLNENIEILNKQIESLNSDYNEEFFKKNQEIERLTSKVKSLEKSNEKKDNDLKQQITQLKRNCSSEIKKLETQKTRLQDEKDKLKNDNKNFENNFRQANEEKTKIMTDKTKLEELIQLNEKIFSSEKEILEQKMLKIIKETENEKTKLQNEIEHLKENETESNKKIKTLETENKTHSDKIQQLIQELSEAQSTNNTEAFQNYISKEEHEKVIGKNTKLTNDVNNLTEEKATFEKNIRKLQKLVDENKELSNKAEIEITKLQNDIKSLKERHLANLSSGIEKKESEFNEKLTILETEKKTLSEKINKISKQLNEAGKNSVNLENYISIDELQKYKNTINSLEESLQKLTEERDSIYDENKKFQEEKSVLSEEIKNLKQQHELEMEDLWQKNSDLKIDHKEKLTNLVSQYEKTINDLKDEKNQMELKYSALLPVDDIEIVTNKTSPCPIKNCDGSGNINLKHDTHRSINNCPKNPKNAETKKIISELQKQIRELQTKLEDMKITAETKNNFEVAVDNVFKEENSELKDKNRKLKEKKNKYKYANQDLNLRIEKLSEEINNLREESEKKNCEIVALKAKKESCSRLSVDSRFDAIEKARRKIENNTNIGRNIAVGSYRSTGPKNGRTVYLGPSQGLFTFNPGNTKAYISDLELENIILDE